MFKPKHNLPTLASYDKPAPPSYWKHFPKNYKQPAVSLINPEKLWAMALECDFPDKVLLKTICNDVKHGAHIGCKGDYRNPTKASNAPSALENGERVSDAIADWVSKGFAFGPVDPSMVPKEAKFSGLMAREKPNGAVRVILNLSAPAGHSVNDGICSDDFPTTMASTTQWLRALNRAGRNSWMAKVDWASAYKHLPVAKEDTNLQWFSWAGKSFKELCLIFGGRSSAGLFDRLAKVVLHIVLRKAKFPKEQACQYLDDCCAVSASLPEISHYDSTFSEVADALGVELAPRDDPEKSFGPSKSGVVLGIHYNTATWIWSFPHEKFARLLHDLQFILDNPSARQDFMQRVMGKLIHVCPLVPTGKFNLVHIIKATSVSSDPKFQVPISADLKRQVWFWSTILRTCNGRVSIPDPDQRLPAWALDVFTDAAGGSLDGSLRGVGAVCRSWWTQLPWGDAINAGHDSGDGRKLDRVMSALEMLGPLLAIASAAKELQGGAMRVWVDNAATVFIYNKGYSTSCPISAALAAAIAQVAAFIGCRVEVVKITRCSNPWASMADALSKGALSRFLDLKRSTPGAFFPTTPLEVPRPLVDWVRSPSADWGLGDSLIGHLRRRGLGLQPAL